jgi:hypothetical protein
VVTAGYIASPDVVDLLLANGYHVVLGLGLFALVWLVGAGYVRGRGDALDGYPVGLLAVTAAAFLLVLSPWLALVGAAIVAPVARARVRVSWRTAAWAAAPVLILPFSFGLMFHGPTETLDSAANAENLWWANRIWSADESVLPYRDLLAEGQRIVYVEGAASFIGASLADLPGFDAILFNTTALPAFLFASVVAAGRSLTSAHNWGIWGSLLSLIAVASIAYPSFPIESPPVALALPIGFVAYRLLAEGQRSFVGFAAGISFIAVALLLSKVIALLPLGIAALIVLYDRYWVGLERRERIRVAGAAAGGAVAIVVTLFATASWYRTLFEPHFLPLSAGRGLADQLTERNATRVAPTFQVAGEVLLFVALLRARAAAFAAAFGTSVAASWLLTGQGFYMAVGFAVLFGALFFHANPERLYEQRWILAPAAAALATWTWLQDIAGLRVALVFLALTLFAFLVAFRSVRTWSAGVAAVIAFSAWAAGSFRLERDFNSLSSLDHDIWARVGDTVPRDGVVFTSLTGTQVTLHRGWNNYPSASRRQLYLAGWYDGRLVADPVERDRRLRLNRRVLGGSLDPDDLELEQDFSSHWAVVRSDEDVPVTFRRIYANEMYALYEIP